MHSAPSAVRRMTTVALAVLICVFLLMLTACEPVFIVTPYHEHTFSEEWSGDETAHWHEATCEHTDLTDGYGRHEPQSLPGREATLTEPGLTEGESCAVCGKILKAQKVIPPTDPNHEHTYETTWTSDAEYHWHAASCGHTDAVADRAPHTPVTLPPVPPTRESTGLSEGSACSVCGRVLVEQRVIPRLTADTVRVMVVCQTGARVEGTAYADVEVGRDVTFRLTLDATYVVTSVSAGSYRDGVLTLSSVIEATTVYVYTEDLGYDTTVQYRFLPRINRATDLTSSDAAMLNAGTEVHLRAGDAYRIFLGWSLGATLENGGTLLSADRDFTFRLSPSLASGGIIAVYVNYAESDSYYYDPNGGTVDSSSINMSATGYYTAVTDANGRVQVTPTEEYLAYAESVSLFWDDGTFTRTGYRLAGYNTAADGSGEWYSPGAKFYAKPVGDAPAVLYCIWLAETPASDFTYEPCEIPRPTNVTAQRAPHWKTTGIRITGYTGDADSVVIPESIDGQYVIAIGAGAFSGKHMTSLAFPRFLLQAEDGAFSDCTSLDTLWYPDGIYYISDAAFGAATLASLHHLSVSATVAPRFATTNEGAFSVKLSRLLASEGERRIIVISGSSSFQGLSSAYFEALMENAYRLVNFGTTRTTNGILYLEAMQHYARADDIILYAPENSVYMMGETELYWKTLRDLESMNNIYRYVDIAHYTCVFDAFADFNSQRMTRNPNVYEAISDQQNRTAAQGRTNLYGEYILARRAAYCDDSRYTDTYLITMNERYKSMLDGKGAWSDPDAAANANREYNDPDSVYWVNITDDRYTSEMNRAIALARSGGARVYFSFAPVDGLKLSPEAQSTAWLAAYDEMIRTHFDFDGTLGSSLDYVFAHRYFYDCAYHLNDYGRVYRTYRVYVDLSALLGISIRAFDSEGTDFEGCLFEEGCVDGSPVTRVTFSD